MCITYILHQYFYMCVLYISATYILLLYFYMCVLSISATHVLHLYFYTCNTYVGYKAITCMKCVLQMFYTCVTGVRIACIIHQRTYILHMYHTCDVHVAHFLVVEKGTLPEDKVSPSHKHHNRLHSFNIKSHYTMEQFTWRDGHGWHYVYIARHTLIDSLQPIMKKTTCWDL